MLKKLWQKLAFLLVLVPVVFFVANIYPAYGQEVSDLENSETTTDVDFSEEPFIEQGSDDLALPNKISVVVKSISEIECSDDFELGGTGEDCVEAIFSANGKDESVEIPKGSIYLQGGVSVNAGDRIFVNEISNPDDSKSYFFAGFDRTLSLLIGVIMFAIMAVVIGGFTGFKSIISLVITSGVLVGVAIPLIVQGNDPVLVGSISGALILVVSIYFSHGFNKSSTVAILGTLGGVVFSLLISMFLTSITKLTGYGDENSFFVAINADVQLDMRGILLASFILGGVGVIDDAAVSQVFVVQELLRTGKNFKFGELFFSALRVGRSHIGSLINTLFMAYVSSSLPLVILLIMTSVELLDIINMDIFAEEIVRTLVGSMGLFFAIPMTTLIACYILRKSPVSQLDKLENLSHGHKHS